jgi:hypothetical protein
MMEDKHINVKIDMFFCMENDYSGKMTNTVRSKGERTVF